MIWFISEDKFNVNFVSNIRKLLSKNITQLIDTHLPQCKSTDEAKKMPKMWRKSTKIDSIKIGCMLWFNWACSEETKGSHSINLTVGYTTLSYIFCTHVFRPSAKIKTGNLDFYFFHFSKKYGRRSRKPEPEVAFFITTDEQLQ